MLGFGVLEVCLGGCSVLEFSARAAGGFVTRSCFGFRVYGHSNGAVAFGSLESVTESRA